MNKHYLVKIPVEMEKLPVLYFWESENESEILQYEQFEQCKQFCNPVPSMWEIVNISIDYMPFLMLVDESGLYHDLFRNVPATFLYGGYSDIVGDVIICKRCFDDPSEMSYLNENDVNRLLRRFNVNASECRSVKFK